MKCVEAGWGEAPCHGRDAWDGARHLTAWPHHVSVLLRTALMRHVLVHVLTTRSHNPPALMPWRPVRANVVLAVRLALV